MIALAAILLLLLPGFPTYAADLHNQLAGSTSPYLAMHTDDPVAWQTWSPETLARARAEKRLIFISSGFFACHWCHVLQQQSFRDPAFAGLLNRHFMPVKVDREADPALDAELRRAMQAITGRAGWPLNLILTPDGDPLYGFIYAPREVLISRLQILHNTWRSDPARIQHMASQASDELRPKPSTATTTSSAEARALIREALLADADLLSGGFGQGAKFPHAPRLLAMLRLLEGYADADLREQLLLTLDAMAHGGLRDLLGGGFFRYTVDPSWQIPHFEQMLVDQALLSRVYLRAGERLGRPDLRAIGTEIIDAILRDFAHPQGGYVAALSALDRTGHEGGGYLWTKEALSQAVPATLRSAVDTWQWVGHDGWGPGRLPTRMTGSNDSRQASQHLASVRPRPVHPRDEQRPPAANGLLLASLSEACAMSYGPACNAAPSLAGHLMSMPPESFQTLQDAVSVAEGLAAWGTWRDEPRTIQRARMIALHAAQSMRTARGWQTSRRALPNWADASNALPDDEYPSATARWFELARHLGLEHEPYVEITHDMLQSPLQHVTALTLAAGDR